MFKNFRRSYDLKYAVDTFCYGMFLFDLVTGKSPSDIDPKTNKLFRDVMLKRSPQEPINEYVDDIVGYDLWAKLLYWFGKECTIEIANQRPKMESVLPSISFLFDLVTGKSPSDIDPKTNKLFRDVMLKRSPQEPINEYVDKNVGYDLWAKLLYCFGKECTNEIANQHPKVESVLLSISSASDVLNIVNANGTIPDIVCRPIPENSGSCIVVTEEDITSESASIEMSKETSNGDAKLSSGVPDEVADSRAIPDIVCRPNPENSENYIIITKKDITSGSASTEMSQETSNGDQELSSGVPNVVAAGGAIPDIVRRLIPENSGSCIVVSEENITSQSEHTESASTERSKETSN